MTRKQFLSLILLISITAVLFLPIYTNLYLYPAFTDHLLKDAENSAVQLADHLTHYFYDPEDMLQKESIHSDVIEEVREMVVDFGVQKVKLFSPAGEVL